MIIYRWTLLTYLLTHLHTYSMVQSPSWEANWFAASQEIPRILRNPKVHYRTHERPPPVSILGQHNRVHIPTSHLLEIHPNIIHPSTPRSPQWSLSLQFPHQDHIHPPLLTYMRHMPSPSHSSRFYHPHNIGWGTLLRIKKVSEEKTFRENQNTHFMFNNIFMKIVPLWVNVDKYGTARQATGDIIWLICIACWITKATHTQWKYVIYCFCTATMVGRTPFNVTFLCTFPVLLWDM